VLQTEGERGREVYMSVMDDTKEEAEENEQNYTKRKHT
jgi:hypothetical protein